MRSILVRCALYAFWSSLRYFAMERQRMVSSKMAWLCHRLASRNFRSSQSLSRRPLGGTQAIAWGQCSMRPWGQNINDTNCLTAYLEPVSRLGSSRQLVVNNSNTNNATAVADLFWTSRHLSRTITDLVVWWHFQFLFLVSRFLILVTWWLVTIVDCWRFFLDSALTTWCCFCYCFCVCRTVLVRLLIPNASQV